MSFTHIPGSENARPLRPLQLHGNPHPLDHPSDTASIAGYAESFGVFGVVIVAVAVLIEVLALMFSVCCCRIFLLRCVVVSDVP